MSVRWVAGADRGVTLRARSRSRPRSSSCGFPFRRVRAARTGRGHRPRAYAGARKSDPCARCLARWCARGRIRRPLGRRRGSTGSRARRGAVHLSGSVVRPPPGWVLAAATSLNPLSDPPARARARPFPVARGDASLYAAPVGLMRSSATPGRSSRSASRVRAPTRRPACGPADRGRGRRISRASSARTTRWSTRASTCHLLLITRSGARVVVVRAYAAEISGCAAPMLRAALASTRADPALNAATRARRPPAAPPRPRAGRGRPAAERPRAGGRCHARDTRGDHRARPAAPRHAIRVGRQRARARDGLLVLRERDVGRCSLHDRLDRSRRLADREGRSPAR